MRTPVLSPRDCDCGEARAVISGNGPAFLCPCHGSLFSADGAVTTKGPATRALPAVAPRISGNNVLVDLSTAVPADLRV